MNKIRVKRVLIVALIFGAAFASRPPAASANRCIVVHTPDGGGFACCYQADGTDFCQGW